MTFVKGESGNPAGRPPGARNRASLIAEGLLDDEAERITRKAVERALAGDPAAMRLCMGHILPRGKARPVPLPLPTVKSAADLPAATAEILGAVGAGRITPGEAQQLVTLLEAVARLLDLAGAAERLARIEPVLAELLRREMQDERPWPVHSAQNTSAEQRDPASAAREAHQAAKNTSAEQAPARGSPSAARPPSPANTSAEQAGVRLGAQSQRPQPWTGAPNTSPKQAGWGPGGPPEWLGSGWPIPRQEGRGAAPSARPQ